MANLCDYNCATLPEHEQISCGQFRKGGLSAAAFVDCDANITDWSDETEWNAAIAAGKVRIIAPIRGSIPEPTPVEGENPNGCGSATILDTFDRTVEIKDYNVNANNIDFYNQLNRTKKQVVLFAGCDGQDEITVIDSSVTFVAREVLPENNREKRMFMITGKWTEYDMPMIYTAPAGIFN